jgi:hypothetical protein|tara:strand:- start:64 stop:279 length:216 start_codon:yes stop_codon:yes gene_type:complete
MKMINNTLFGVHTEDIHRVYLADNEWYEINASIQVENNKYFSAWCIRESDNASLRVVGNIDNILLAEAQYS